MAKYKFRKMYFVCKNKQVISANVQSTNAYQSKEHAEVIRQQWQPASRMEWMSKDEPLPKYTVEGFYLVPEALYNEILKEHTEEK